MGSFVLGIGCAVEVRLSACVLAGGGNLDGPGGSQVPDAVAHAMADYLINANANDGGPFVTSELTRRLLAEGRLAAADFLGCAVGLGVASLSIDAAGSTKLYLIMAGVMLFNFMTNIGPNAQTYLLAGEVFPTEVRGMGAGFAAMIGSIVITRPSLRTSFWNGSY